MNTLRYPSETIAAIATAAGRGGVGIVRISGRNLAEFARQLCGNLPSPRMAALTSFRAADQSLIDSGLILYFPAPHSFTGEDVIELHGHGGPIVLNLLLRRCLDLGARLAEPGEFTRRAYLNGKIDLTQAEAVADLIDAASAAAARSAARSLQGEFSREIDELLDALTRLQALTEATLDFPGEEIDFLESANAFGQLEELQNHLNAVFDRARQGRLLQEGLHVVIVGQPNVGKSSLLNCLIGDELAIVTPIAGTTRDIVSGTLHIEGIPLHIIDTAGLRDTDDEVERIGIDRAWREINRADAIILLVDSRSGVSESDRKILARLPQQPAHLIIHNKIDLVEKGDCHAERQENGNSVSLFLSAKTGEGVELLRRELLRIAGWHPAENVFIARERHLQALAQTREHLAQACRQLPQLELFAEELRLAQRALASITGAFTTDDLLGKIFSQFCIGK
mgnify:FL=1